MDYLTIDNLDAHIYRRFITEIGVDYESILDSLEKQNIALIKSKLNGRFDVAKIFNQEPEERHWLIIKLLSKLVLYDLVRRNATRKVPEDYVTDWEWAMKLLEKIKAGKETPEGLPEKISDGAPAGSVISGNGKTSEYYY